ncbi:hypothetical protein MRX96_005916 [Rhipicephalus microplus]
MQAAAESLTSAKETDVLNDATAATDESETSTQTVQEPAEGGAMEWHDAEEPEVATLERKGCPSNLLSLAYQVVADYSRTGRQDLTDSPRTATHVRVWQWCASNRHQTNSFASCRTV